MAVTTDFQKLKSMIAVDGFDFDPDSADATDVGWVDMKDFESILVIFQRTVGSSALDTVALLANPESDGGGTDVTVKTVTVTDEPDAVADVLLFEVTAEEIQEAAGSSARYVSASIEFATSTDEAVVTYIRLGKRRHLDLAANSIA